MPVEQTVYIVEDDVATRESLVLLLGLKGYRTRAFGCAEDFLQAYEPAWAGCLLLDVKMSGMSGLELQATLSERGIALPVIVISAFGDVATARTVFKGGALDFLEKPVIPATMLAAVSAALELDAGRRQTAQAALDADVRFKKLTAREQEVMELIVAGCHNQEIADQLKISPRTVQVHRARVMAKFEVDRVAHLVRIAQRKP